MGWFCTVGVALVAGLATGCAIDSEVWDPIADPSWEADRPPGPIWPDHEPLDPAFDTPSWVTMPATGRVSIGWRTVSIQPGAVELFEDDGSEMISPSATAIATETSDGTGLIHHVQFDVEVGAAYRYRVTTASGAVRLGVFSIPAAETWRFLHLAEVHAPSNSDIASSFGPMIREFGPQLLIESGDMVDSGDDIDHWRAYLRDSSDWISNLILLPSHSNHANGISGNQHLLDHFELPGNGRWYRTRYGAAEIFTIDSTFDGSSPDVLAEPDWIREQMSQLRDEPSAPELVVAAWHYPACSSSYAGRSSQRRWVLDHLVSAFGDVGGVDLVLVGHDKYYERSVIEQDGKTTVQVMSNAGKLAPSSEGQEEPECLSVRRNTETRSVIFAEVSQFSIVGQAHGPRGQILDWFSVTSPRNN